MAPLRHRTGQALNGFAQFVRSAEPPPAISRRTVILDVGLAVLLAAVAVPVEARNGGFLGGPLGLRVLALSVGLAAPLAVRRIYPLAVFLVVTAIALAFGGPANIFTFIALIFAAYSASVHSRFRGALLVVIAGVAGLITALFSGLVPPLPARYTTAAVLLPAAAVGSAVHRWRQRAAQSRAEVQRLEADQQEATRRALERERARLASEMHDVVTHNVSVMVIQAGAARQVLADSPQTAREALLAVEASGRTALTELRQLLGLLTSTGLTDQAQAGRERPGLRQLAGLIERIRGAGLTVDLRVRGEPQELAGATDLAAYRVVQEGLTNVLKHAGPVSAEVTISYRSTEVVIEVTNDDERSAPPPSAGFSESGLGLPGLRQRLALIGGTVQAGPLADGAWRLSASIPLSAPPGTDHDPLGAGPPLSAGHRR
jgi:signal transduction histidine kinase